MKKDNKDIKKIIGFWLLVILVGGISGVFFSRSFLPWLTSFSPFNKIGWLCSVKDNTTIINRTDKIYISEETAYREAINKVGVAVVAVEVERAGRLLVANSGFILTNDGLVATANFSLPRDAKISIWREGQQYEARLVKQDEANGLALLKIEVNNLPVVDFGDNGNLNLGERLVLVGAVRADKLFSRFVDIGIIKTILPEISFSFSESSLANGAPLADIEGKVLGLALVDKSGNISLVEQNKIKELMK